MMMALEAEAKRAIKAAGEAHKRFMDGDGSNEAYEEAELIVDVWLSAIKTARAAIGSVVE